MRPRQLILLLAACCALLVAAPASSWAADGQPDQMVDPASAMEPEMSDGAEDAPVNDGTATAAENGMVEMDGSAMNEPDAANAAPTGGGAATSATASAPITGGSLPFTGVGDGQIALLLVIGSLLLAAGATAWSFGRTPRVAAR